MVDFAVVGLVVSFSSRVVSAVKGILLNAITKFSSSSSICSNSSIVKSKCCNGFFVVIVVVQDHQVQSEQVVSIQTE